jgi:hypothetical protein
VTKGQAAAAIDRALHRRPRGAVVINVFGPPRNDWGVETMEPQPPLWPGPT